MCTMHQRFGSAFQDDGTGLSDVSTDNGQVVAGSQTCKAFAAFLV